MNTDTNPLSTKRILHIKDKNNNIIRIIEIISYNFDKKCNLYYEEKNSEKEKSK